MLQAIIVTWEVTIQQLCTKQEVKIQENIYSLYEYKYFIVEGHIIVYYYAYGGCVSSVTIHIDCDPNYGNLSTVHSTLLGTFKIILTTLIAIGVVDSVVQYPGKYEVYMRSTYACPNAQVCLPGSFSASGSPPCNVCPAGFNFCLFYFNLYS